MPGPAVHHIIAREYLSKVLKIKYADSSSMTFWNKMDVGEYAPYFHLGAQGPDFLFFNMNDWPLGGTIKTVAQTYWEVQDFMRDLVSKVKNLIPPEIWAAVDELEAMADDAAERSATISEIEALAGDIKNNINAIKTLIEAKIEDYVTDSYDLFNLMKHPQQHGQPFKDWWWFDILHIRRSGQFLSALMAQSADFSAQRAYAHGYLTHYAADTVGHAYVNAIAGGPYRTHSQRHKVVENHQDVWAFSNYIGGEFITSSLANQYVINGDSDKLPTELKRFIISCIKKVYYNSAGDTQLYGKGIAEEDLDVAYRCWLQWFTGSTNDLKLPLPQPYSLTAEIAEAWQKFLDNLGDIGDYVEDSASGGGSLLGFLKALAALIVGPILLGLAIIDFLAGEIATLGAAPIRYFLSLIYEGLYDSYMNLRKGLVMNGFSFPMTDQLNNYITRHMLNTKIPDVYGHDAKSLPDTHAYPSSKFKMSGMEGESHLIYPWPAAESGEPDLCTGFPDNYYSADPSFYMTGASLYFNPTKYEYYRQFVESGSTGATPDSINSKFAELAMQALTPGLGNAVNFSDALYAEFRSTGIPTNFIDFNLDSDKGYAFKSWRKVKDVSLLNSTVNDYTKTNVQIETDKQIPNINTDIIYPERSAL